MDLGNSFKMSLNDFAPFETDSIFIFEAGNEEELKHHIDTTLKNFDDELEEIRRQYENVDLITYNLTFSNNKAFITNLYFLDTANQKVIDVFETTVNSVSPVFWAGVVEILLGKCPEGWTNNGSYSSEKGISAQTEKILVPSLQKNGDCVDVRFARGLLSVQIFSKKC